MHTDMHTFVPRDLGTPSSSQFFLCPVSILFRPYSTPALEVTFLKQKADQVYGPTHNLLWLP